MYKQVQSDTGLVNSLELLFSNTGEFLLQGEKKKELPVTAVEK